MARRQQLYAALIVELRRVTLCQLAVARFCQCQIDLGQQFYIQIERKRLAANHPRKLQQDALDLLSLGQM